MDNAKTEQCSGQLLEWLTRQFDGQDLAPPREARKELAYTAKQLVQLHLEKRQPLRRAAVAKKLATLSRNFRRATKAASELGEDGISQVLLASGSHPMNIVTFRDPAQPSVQDMLDKAMWDETVPATRRTRLRAAVATFARLMGRPAAELPAHQGFIIQQMRRLRRRPTGLSPKTLSNTRSELLYLVKSGRGRGPRSFLPISDEWAQFREALRHGPAWWSLSRLAGYSSRQDVAPPSVDDAHIARFIEALRRSGEVADPFGHARRVIRVWNKLAAECHALQISPLTLSPQMRNRWTLPEACVSARLSCGR